MRALSDRATDWRGLVPMGRNRVGALWASYSFTRAFIRTHHAWIDLAVCSGLVALAFALRWPNFMTVPALTDEFKEVGVALDLLRNHQWPVVGYDAYDGPLFSYMIASAFRLFGLNPDLPRLVVLAVGVLTVAATYGLAKELGRGDRAVGTAAALLLAFNAYHIYFSSHVAWSNNMTPLFTTLAIWFYHRAVRLLSARWLIGAGFLFGLAAQTHPSALALAPAFVVDLAIDRRKRQWLKHAAPYLAVAAALVAYAPVIYYNVITSWGSLRAAEYVHYAYESAPSLEKIFPRISPFLGTVSLLALGSFRPIEANAVWLDPVVMTFWIATVLVLLAWARRGEGFPLIGLLASSVLVVTYDRGFGLSDGGRYFQFLLPQIYAAWAWAGVRLWNIRSIPRFNFPQVDMARRVLLAALFLFLLAMPVSELRDYYAYSFASGENNVALLDIVQRVRADPVRPILLASTLFRLDTGRGGDAGEGLAYLLKLDGRSVEYVDDGDATELRRDLQNRPRAYLIASDHVVALLGPPFALHTLLTAHFPCSSCGVSDFTLFDWDASSTPAGARVVR